MGGGAWPFLVGGVICLVDEISQKESDSVFFLKKKSAELYRLVEELSAQWGISI
jgi:hypothetical protein